MKTETVSELKQEAKALKLSYGADNKAGYTRAKKGDKFIYYDTDGMLIDNEDDLKRIKTLAIPPAWTNVWISPKANGHLQATGVDVAGRKQYKYHAAWTKFRNDRKHNMMWEFSQVLPQIREQIEKDLHGKDFSKNKVVALAVSIMDKTHIRVGNSVYSKLYGSFGLTSLRNRHIKVSGNKMIISFRGKKGVQQEVTLTQKRLVNMLKKLKDIPGQELFQFFDENGVKKSLDSDAVNEYITACTGKDFIAKDFRTWWGTVAAIKYLSEQPAPSNKSETQKNIIAALDSVAENLGNTRTVCKKYYVHPILISHYEEGKLEKYMDMVKESQKGSSSDIITEEEKIIIEFIKQECVNC